MQSLACSGEYVTRWTYDEASKVLSVTDAGGGVYSFVYDGARNLIGKQDANGSLTTYGYDELDRRTDEWQHLDAHARLSSRVEVLGLGTEAPATAGSGTGTLHWHYVLDENGNPHTTTDPRGLVTTRDYGVLNRLLTVSYDRPAQVTYPLLRSVVYQYDGNGNVDLVTEEKETGAGTIQEVTDPTYDTLDRLQREQRYDGKVVEYEYDLKGNRKKVTDPDEVATTYEYDALDRLVTATTPEGETTYRYWPDGLEQGRSLPNGVEEGRCYDATGRVSQITTARGAVATDCQSFTTVVSGFRYEYDGNGNRKVQVEQRTSPGSLVPGSAEETRYGYDGQDRLAGVRYGDGQAVLYRLDAVGNRTGERELAGQPASLDLGSFSTVDASALVRDVTATFNRADWLLSRADARDATRNATFGWDLAGNLVTKEKAGQSRQLRWDARNTLQAVVENGVVVGTYDYEADGLRVKRHTATEQVEYVLDEQYVLQEARGDLTGHPSYRRYHYAEGPLSVTDSAGARFIGTDALGSTTDLTSATGAVVAAHQYDAWGQYRNGTAPGSTDAKLGYTGHQFDPETGLVYARARYYDPEVGIFISRDPFEMPAEGAPHLHRYTYADNRPTMFADESGQFIPLLVIGAILIAAEIDFWHQQNVNQTASVDDILNKTNFGEVGLAGAAGGAAMLTGVGAGAAAAAGAGALGLGAVGTGITAGAVGGGVTAGLDALSSEAIDVAADRKEAVDWGRVGKSTAVGTVLGGVLGGVAGKVSKELTAFGDDLADAAAKGFQEGAREAAGASAAPATSVSAAAAGARAAPAGQAVAQVVEATARPGTVKVPASTAPEADAAALAREREKLVRVLHQRELGLDPKKGWLPEEARTATKVEQSVGRLSRHPSPEYDWADAHGRTYDAVGPVPREHFDADSFLKQLNRHLTRKQGLDKVVVDLAGLEASQVKRVEDYLSKLTAAEQARVLVVR